MPTNQQAKLLTALATAPDLERALETMANTQLAALLDELSVLPPNALVLETEAIAQGIALGRWHAEVDWDESTGEGMR